MIACLAIAILVGAAALCRLQNRHAAAWRGGLLADCAALLDAPRIGRDRAGFPTLSGACDGKAVGMRLLPDTLVHRRLPQLWLRLSLRTPLPTTATLAILRRPVGAEFYAPDDLPSRYPVPTAWPADTLVRGSADAHRLLAEVADDLGAILADARVKEVLLTPGGLRLTVQASEGARGAYLLLRGSRFLIERVSPRCAGAALQAGLHLTHTLSNTGQPLHARAA